MDDDDEEVKVEELVVVNFVQVSVSHDITGPRESDDEGETDEDGPDSSEEEEVEVVVVGCTCLVNEEYRVVMLLPLLDPATSAPERVVPSTIVYVVESSLTTMVSSGWTGMVTTETEGVSELLLLPELVLVSEP